MTADRSAPAVDDADLVNGPEDVLGDWDEVEWRRVEQDVRRLRQRIFTASQAGDLKRVRNLQKLMLRSRANTLVSCLLYTSDAADDLLCVDLGGRRIIKKQ